jgi:hypothetical protein
MEERGQHEKSKAKRRSDFLQLNNTLQAQLSNTFAQHNGQSDSDNDMGDEMLGGDRIPSLLSIVGDKQMRITRRMAAKATRAIVHRASLLTLLALANENALNEAFDEVLERRATSGWLVASSS